MKNLKRIFSLIVVLTLILGSMPLTMFTASAVETPENTEIVYGSGGTITRAEWLHDLSVVFDMTVESDAVPDNYFGDLEDSHMYYKDILLTVEFGVIDVKAGENVYPDALVSRDFAVTTLNFCLGYQASEDDVLTFTDADECTSPTDALIAIERGWLKLVGKKFMPDNPVTSAEVKTMLDDAAAILQITYIEENYDSKYVFASDVKVIPKSVPAAVSGDTVIIENSPVTIRKGDRFAVYENGIPAVYVAKSVEANKPLTIITVTRYDGADAYENVDAQGLVASDNMDLIPAEGVEIEIEEEEEDGSKPEPVSRRIPGVKAVKAGTSEKKIKKSIKANKKIELDSGITANVTVKINEPVIKYQVTGSYTYVTVEGDSEISYNLTADAFKMLDTKSVTLFSCPVAGIGFFDINVEVKFAGTISGSMKGYLVAGIECTKGDRIRSIYNFQQKEYFSTTEAEASIGLKVRLGVDKLPFVTAFIYAEIGAKAKLKVKLYTVNQECADFNAYLYFNYGAEAEVDFIVWKTSVKYNFDVYHEKNSPVKIAHHYENGVEVPRCTRESSGNNYYTNSNSHYGGSGWSKANRAYGLSSEGSSVPLYEYEVKDGNATITEYKGNSYYVNIPEEIDGYPVTEIGYAAFRDKGLRSVVIPDSVTKIEDYAFDNCISLKEVNLPKSLTQLGYLAFGSTAIESIEIPKSLDTAYSNGTYSYTFDGVKYSIYGGPFYHCDKLKTVSFESGTTQIAENLFRGCTGLEEITIPDTVTVIEYGSFSDCLRLRTINIGNSVTKIDEHAFSNCVSLPSVIIPDSVTEIGRSAFESCKSLESIIIPGSVTEIGDYAFSSCSALESVKLPSTLNDIRERMFQDCAALKTIEFPSTVKTIQDRAFSGCTALESFTFENGLSDLQEIRSDAFRGCTSLKEAVLPETVNTIGESVFQNCVSLEKVYIPQSTKTLGSSVFQGDEALYDVTISDYSITKINDYTFKDCPALSSITLPKGLTTVGSQAFMNDTSLFNVTIPESVTSINSSALSYPDKTTIYGKAGSYAETFAVSGGFKFNDIGIAAEGISLLDGIKNITMDEGETYRAVFEVYPENANDVITITSNDSHFTINGHDIRANYSGDSVLTATASSGASYDFNVHVRGVSKIAVKTPADKLSYLIGEEFDKTGLIVEVIYNDDTTKEVTDYTISGFDSSAEGTCTVTISWVEASGWTRETTFTVEIIDPSPKLTEILIETLPEKRLYERKEPLDLTGMVVIGVYTDGSRKEITDYKVSGYNALQYGKQTITVSYNEKTAEFTVGVNCANPAFGDWITAEDPTCTKPGKRTRTCANCGYVDEEEIPALGHVLGELKWKWDGSTAKAVFICSVCGETVTVDADVASTEKDGNIIYTATVEIDGKTYKNTLQSLFTAGDVNGDNEVNNKDVVALFRYVSSDNQVEDESAYDFNGDMEVNNKDVVALFRYVSSLM